ncbi:MAG TPA: F0F1 ATP synthase subunit B [Bacteroidota bacterium]|nr:F0F1 ATP synthase subunit B [Bacteroidota bacterium]
MLEPNPGLILWTIVTFLVLLFLLRKYAWKPLLDALQQREASVRRSVEQAEQAKQEAEQLVEEHRKQLEQAEHEGHRILNESRTLADKLKGEILESAQKQSQRMIEQARAEIGRDKDAALSQLRHEVASLAVQAAGKILDETLDDQKHRKIVDNYLKELPNN